MTTGWMRDLYVFILFSDLDTQQRGMVNVNVGGVSTNCITSDLHTASIVLLIITINLQCVYAVMLPH